MAAKSGKSVEKWSSRFQFLLWPLTLFDETNQLKKEDLAVSERAKRTRYPMRAMRYWWALCAIQDEARRLGRAPVVVDLGCERGTLRRLAGPRRWLRLIAAAGMQVEFLTGSHLMRLSGNPLENSLLWIRFNQLWGALFPSLGSEVYLQARN